MLVASIFSLFLQCFLPILERFPFLSKFILSSANTFNLDQPNMWTFGKEFINFSTCISNDKIFDLVKFKLLTTNHRFHKYLKLFQIE